MGRLHVTSSRTSILAVRYAKNIPGRTKKPSPVIRRFRRSVQDYFSGKRTDLRRFPKVCVGTDFQKSVWDAALRIPYGQTKTYGEIAAAIGRPRSARAVGNALNRNPLLLIVPCHRVVPASGGIGGFACGTKRKRAFLAIEKSSSFVFNDLSPLSGNKGGAKTLR